MNEQPKKKLSQQAIDLINTEANRLVTSKLNEEIEFFRENIVKVVADNMLKLRTGSEKQRHEEKLKTADLILKKYRPLQKEIKTIEETLLTTENIKFEENEYFKKMMTSEFYDNKGTFDDNFDYYIELRQAFNFIEKIINEYEEKLKNTNKKLEEILEKENNQRVVDSIYRNECKLIILEEYYKKDVPIKQIKFEHYDNERKFARDKKELLSEIAPYFTGIYAIIDILG
jgi:hypothetical protein